MERVSGNDLILDNVGLGLVAAEVTKDLFKVEADRERARALRRQQRNGILIQPYEDVRSRMNGLQFSKSEVRFGDVADIRSVGALFLDTMSEMMIQSPAMLVPHDDIVGALVPEVAAMCSNGIDQAKYLVEKFIDLLSNRENGSKPFEVRHWSLEKKNWGVERIRYLVYEEVADEKGWRLSEDGMRMTLRILDTDTDVGNLNHDLLDRAFARKNIDDILHNLRQHKISARRQSALIQAAVRDIRMLTFLHWDHVGDPIREGRAMTRQQSLGTKTFSDNINKLKGDETIEPSQRARLAQALDTLREITDATRKLYGTILDSEVEVREFLSSSIRVMGGQTMLPDMFAQVLVPMVGLKGREADAYCNLISHIFTSPKPVAKVFDLQHILIEGVQLLDEIADGEEAVEEDEEEVFVDLESMDIRTRKEVKDIFVQLVRVKPILSDYIREVLANEKIRDTLKKPLIFQALAPPAGYRSVPIGEKYLIAGVMSGDDLEIGKE